MRYCRNCKTFVKPEDHFSLFWFIVLMIPFFLFLWLIYLIYCINKDKGHICPMCGSETSKYKPLELSHPEKDDAVFLNQFVKAKQAARIQQSSTKKMKICSYCGDSIDEDLKYCHYCGSKQ